MKVNKNDNLFIVFVCCWFVGAKIRIFPVFKKTSYTNGFFLISDGMSDKLEKLFIFASDIKMREAIMTAIEMKYSLFKEIDSIEDESVLDKLAAFLKSLIAGSTTVNKTDTEVNKDGIPEFIRNMSVRTGMTGDEDVKEIMHKHWEEKYG